MKILAAGLLLAATLSAQSSETQLFRAVLLPANELPAINNTARGIADVTVSVVRDTAGTVVNGTIDVYLRSTLTATVTATGLNLHNAPAGQSAAPMFSAGLSTSNVRVLQTGADAIHVPITIGGDNAATLA